MKKEKPMSETPTLPKPEGRADQSRAPNPNAARKNQFQARLDNQKAQLERHGNFAEVVIRTTPEGTDMINFARLWEHVLVQADRQTRGYVAKSSRSDFETTRKDFEDCIDFMVQRLKSSVARHKIDLTGTNFISRVAQRYQIIDKVRKGPQQSQVTASAAPEDGAQPVKEKASRPQRAAKVDDAPVAMVDDEVDAL